MSGIPIVPAGNVTSSSQSGNATVWKIDAAGRQKRWEEFGKIMKQFLIVFSLILITQTNIVSQDKNDSPILVERFPSETSLEPIEELGLKISNFRTKLDNNRKLKVVVRFCTSEAFKIAVLKSPWMYPSIIYYMDGITIGGKDIIVLKSPDCITKQNSSGSPMEVWVTTTEELPSYTEKYTSDQISIKKIGESTWYAGNRDYLNNTKKIIRELRKDKSSFGVILGFYIKESGENNIKKKLNRISRSIKENGIKKQQYQIEMRKTTGWISTAEPKYPIFYVVKIQ